MASSRSLRAVLVRSGILFAALLGGCPLVGGGLELDFILPPGFAGRVEFLVEEPRCAPMNPVRGRVEVMIDTGGQGCTSGSFPTSWTRYAFHEAGPEHRQIPLVRSSGDKGVQMDGLSEESSGSRVKRKYFTFSVVR